MENSTYTYKLDIMDDSVKNLFVTQINRRKFIFNVNNKKITIEWIHNEHDKCYYCYNYIDNETVKIHTQKLKNNILNIPWISKKIQNSVTFCLSTQFSNQVTLI